LGQEKSGNPGGRRSRRVHFGAFAFHMSDAKLFFIISVSFSSVAKTSAGDYCKFETNMSLQIFNFFARRGFGRRGLPWQAGLN
jgi:hypothetical protein